VRICYTYPWYSVLGKELEACVNPARCRKRSPSPPPVGRNILDSIWGRGAGMKKGNRNRINVKKMDKAER
jgi:hypothetical protein